MALILGLTLGQLILFPLPSYAPDDETEFFHRTFGANADGTVDEIPSGLAETLRQIEDLKATSDRLPLNALERNVALMQDQFLETLPRERIISRIRRLGRYIRIPVRGPVLAPYQKWDLSVLDLTIPELSASPGLTRRALMVDAVENGFALRLPGFRHQHVIKLPQGDSLVNFQWGTRQDSVGDVNFVVLLTSYGHRYVLDIPVVEAGIFKGPIPVYELPRVRMAGGLPAKGLRIVQQLLQPADKSRKAQEAKLDLNPKTLRKSEVIADLKLVEALEENLELVRPVPYHPELEASLRAANNGELPEAAGDVVTLGDYDGQEVIIDVTTPYQITDVIDRQSILLDAAGSISSPVLTEGIQQIGKASGEAKDILNGILGDGDRLKAYFQDRVDSLHRQVGAAPLKAAFSHVAAFRNRRTEAEAALVPHAVRDQFTHEQHLETNAALREHVAKVRTLAEQRATRFGGWDPTKLRGVRRTLHWGIAEKFTSGEYLMRMKRVATILKWPFIIEAGVANAAAADYMFNHGRNVAASIDLLARAWHYSVDHWFPIFNDPQYVLDVARYSVPARLGMLFAVFAAAALARPFMQDGVNTIVTKYGIKYLFSIFQMPPQRWLAKLSGNPQLVRTMQLGHLPPKLLAPFASKVPGVLPQISERVESDKSLRAIARALAINTVAASYGVDPVALLGDVDSPEKLQEAVALTGTLYQTLQGKDYELLRKALAAHGEDFAEAFDRAELLAKDLDQRLREESLKASRPVRADMLQSFVSWVGSFNDESYQELANPQPSEEFSNYIARGAIMDGLLTITTMSTTGKYANPAEPEYLAYQPSIAIFNSHKQIVVNDTEQAVLHFGVSNAVDYSNSAKAERDPHEPYLPASVVNADREIGQRGFFRDTFELMRTALNLRESNHLVGTAKRSYTQCFGLFQGFFITGMIVRLFEPMVDGAPLSSLWDVSTISAAAAGQLFFMYFAPWIYRWFWGVVRTASASFEGRIRAIGGHFEDLYRQLSYSVDNQVEGDAVLQATKVVELYQKRYRKHPAKVWDQIVRQDYDTDLTWAGRVRATALEHSPVPERPNENTMRTLMISGAIITTVLAGYLMAASFDTTWGKVGQVMIFSTAGIFSLWHIGHAFNVVSDTASLALRKWWNKNAPATPRYQTIVKKRENALKEWRKVPHTDKVIYVAKGAAKVVHRAAAACILMLANTIPQ